MQSNMSGLMVALENGRSSRSEAYLNDDSEAAGVGDESETRLWGHFGGLAQSEITIRWSTTDALSPGDRQEIHWIVE